jgi:tetratricopeptide (TPR) repeat protein
MCAVSHYGHAALRGGDPGAAHAHFQRAQDLNRATADTEKLADVGNYLGDCLLEMGDVTRAEREYRAALEISWAHTMIAETLRSVAGIARCRAAAGDPVSGVALARLVTAHPACGFEARQLCQPLLDPVRRADPADRAPGEAGDLGSVVEELINQGGS